jgi:hypothetical protein
MIGKDDHLKFFFKTEQVTRFLTMKEYITIYKNKFE